MTHRERPEQRRFPEYLTGEIEALKTSVGRDLEARFSTVFKSFTDEAETIIQKNQNNVSEILHYTIDDPFSSLKLSFNTDFTMSNGVNVVGLISTLGGAGAGLGIVPGLTRWAGPLRQ